MGDIVQDEIRHAGRQMGVQDMRLLMHWSAVVGEELSRICHPIKISRNRLHVAIGSHQAPNFIHNAPVILESVNRYLGRKAVTRLVPIHHHSVIPASVPAHAPTIPDNHANDPEPEIVPLEGFVNRSLALSCARLLAAARRRDARQPTAHAGMERSVQANPPL